MSKARDSNAFYSGFWRLFFRWFGTGGKGWLRNPFNPDGPKVTLRSYLKLLNFKANHRKVDVQLVLDPNRDAFGRVKNGIPNRVVAYELFNKTKGKIKTRWYDTQGEQFHTKLISIKYKNYSLVFGGSANLTRRNLDNYNLEAELKIKSNNNSQFVKEVEVYFEKIWNNQQGHYTIALEEYSDKSTIKKALYRLQEWSGLSTF
ncbi:hypothetical protein JOC47_000719 [Halanaerobacter jeridensis]|uniref:Phospholipase D-like domain-containing protein n=2 Tax=Halanaerobacter jeridensis TaxID=706427 RepID=A0A938XVA0_9FIRM|nr:hypothetical protein [Halanaerobacter jeridensis]